MKFTVHFTHEVQKHANKEGSLTGRSQKTPCTGQNWFAPTKLPPNIHKRWKQSIFISGCFTQSSSSRIIFLKIAISTKRLFFNRVHWESSEQRVNYRRSKRSRVERLSTLRPSDPAWRHHQTSPGLYRRHGMVKHKITAFTIAGGQPWPCTDAACRSSSSLHFIQGSFA